MTKHIKILQNKYTDKVVDVPVAMQRQVLQIQTMHRKSPFIHRSSLT